MAFCNRWWTASLLITCLFASAAHSASPEHNQRWVAGWGAGPLEKLNPLTEDTTPAQKVSGSLRYFIRISVAGEQVRVRLSNELSTEPLALSSASVVLTDAAGKPRVDTRRDLHFSGKGGLVVPALAPALSDPVGLPVQAGEIIAVTLYLSKPARPDLGGQSPWMVEFYEGVDATNDLENKGTFHPFSSLVTEIDVLTSHTHGAVVALGDSITQGNIDRPISDGAMVSWPEILSSRLQAQDIRLGVVNAGIGGNRVTAGGMGQAGLARFDRDVNSVTGVTHVIIAEGINDIGFTGIPFFGQVSDVKDPEVLIAAYRQYIARAHARGIKIIGATITPFSGSFYFEPDKEKVRSSVNNWIRTSGEFDAVIDFDRVVADPKDPSKINNAYDSGDHLHPNPAGLDKMAQSIDLSIFR